MSIPKVVARLLTAVLLATALFSVSTVADAASCSSTTDEYIHRFITIPQKPLSDVLVQRYVGPRLSIRCLSVTPAAGPTCTSTAVIKLCFRNATDTLGALTCETLGAYAKDANAKIERGSRDGPDVVWVIKLDTSAMPNSCFARTEEVRLLAFVQGKQESSIALFVILLIIVALVLLVAAALIAFACYQRGTQMDGAGAVAAAGPKLNYQGAQINVAEPHLLQPNVERYLLPVRPNGGTEDLSTYYSKIMNDPNYDPAADGVILDDMSRGPRSVKRIMRGSPPRPGDGEDDGQLQRHNDLRRQIAERGHRRRRGGGGDGPDGDRSVFDRFGRRRGGYGNGGDDDYSGSDDDFDYDDPRNLLDINDPNGGEIVYDASGRPIGRRRKRNPRSRRALGGPDGHDLFPTQGGWRTFGGDDDEDDDSEDDDGTGRPGRRRRGAGDGPDFPGGGPNGNGRNIKFVPRWMEGNFGRGGDIPEADTHDGPYDAMANPLDQLQLTAGPNGHNPQNLSQRLNRPLYNPNNNVGAPTPVRQPSSRYDPLSGGSPRGGSVRKGVVGGRTPGVRGDGGGDDAYGNPRGPNGRRSGSRPNNGSFGGGPDGPDGYVGTPRGGAGGGNRRASMPGRGGQPGDAFNRGDVKLHSSKLSLDANSYMDPANMESMMGGGGGRGSRNGSRGPSAAGGLGRDETGAEILPDGSRRLADGTIISPYTCQDCGQCVAPTDPASTFCPANGNRHF